MSREYKCTEEFMVQIAKLRENGIMITQTAARSRQQTMLALVTKN